MKLPNIVLFFTDDQRFDTLHALGNEGIETPNIDRLVARGTSFTRAHIPGGTSGAVCMPSRAMLHTGRTLFHLEQAGSTIPEAHTTLGELLRRNGYQTFGTGKWHNGTEAFHRSFAAGDEIFFGGMADHWNVPVFHYDPTGRYDNRCRRCPDPFHSKAVQTVHCDHIHAGHHSSELVCDAAITFIRAADAGTPFFTYISFLAPHDPRIMPEAFRRRYDAQDMALPPNMTGGHPFDNGALHIRDELLEGFPRTPDAIREHLADYYAMITHLDAELGRVLQALEDKGVLDETLIVFAGDNGLALGQHGLLGKQSLYDHSIRVPLIFAGPGIPAGQQRDALVYLLDIFPTLCDVTGLAVPDSVEGQSLLPVITDGGTGRADLYLAYERYQRGLRDQRYKLIEYVVDGRHNMTQLFDLESDPWELHNLAAEPDQTGRLAAMRTRMLEWRDAWHDRDSEWGQVFWPVWEASAAARKADSEKTSG